uniref:Uncharacterized protein n=1 Tax=Rhizophagus irregularis (strain DAOM 181602 / DAOM 197198 / MUCL 43194) TaxID=747089 RepID=U9T6D6_RHIID
MNILNIPIYASLSFPFPLALLSLRPFSLPFLPISSTSFLPFSSPRPFSLSSFTFPIARKK